MVNAGSATPSQIKAYVEEGRKALKAAGYTGPVVSVDTFIAVINNPDLCDYLITWLLMLMLSLMVTLLLKTLVLGSCNKSKEFGLLVVVKECFNY